MNYLLDTCVVSDFFKKNPLTVQKLESISPNQVYISSITTMEIEYGLQLNGEREIKIRPLWNSFLKLIKVVPYTVECAEATAVIRKNLRKVGLPIGPYDILIAGIAVTHNMIIVTSNFDEFKRIPHIDIENWR